MSINESEINKMTLRDLEEVCADKYRKITLLLIEKNLQITTMESCTSGTIASLITDTAGSSAVMKGAFVTYSNEAKIRCGVSPKNIASYGVYSPQCAADMARAALEAYKADIAVGVTGTFANVDPDNADSRPNYVYIAICHNGVTVQAELSGFAAESRKEAKYFVAKSVADYLLDIISNV